MRFFWLLVVFCTFCNAQSGVIRGIVTDKETGDPLPGMNITLKKSDNLGASSDLDGVFIIFNIPPGTYDIEVSFIGYKDNNEYKDLVITASDTLFISVKMEETPLPDNYVRNYLWDDVLPVFHSWGSREEDDFFSIQNRSFSLISAEFPEFDIYSLTGGQAIRYRNTLIEDQLFYVNGMKLNDPFTSRVNFRVPSFFTDPGTKPADGFESHSFGQTGGKIFLQSVDPSFHSFQLRAVSSELSDAFGYNDISGKFNFRSKSAFGFAGISYLNAADHTPSPTGLIIPGTDIDKNALPGNNSDLLSGIASLTVDIGKWRSELVAIAANRESRNYIPAFGKNNQEHLPLTKALDWQSHFKLVTSKPTWLLNMQIGFRHVGRKTGDGVWFDDLKSYGDIDRNAERGVMLPEPGRNLRGDSLGIFAARGQIYDYFQQSQSRTITARLNYMGLIDKRLTVLAGIDFERHELRYYDIEPLFLARAGENQEELFRLLSVGRYYGYDLYGNDLNTTRLNGLRTSEGLPFFEESAAKTPRTIGSYVSVQQDGTGWDLIFSLRYDNFNPATQRLRNPVNFFGNGPEPLFLDQQDFESAPTEHMFSPRFSYKWYRSLTELLEITAEITYQVPPLMFYYDSWNNLQVLSNTDRFDFLNTGRIKPARYNRVDLSYARRFDALYLRGNISWNQIHNQLVRATILQEFGPQFYSGRQFVNSDTKPTVYGFTLDGSYRFRGQFNFRLSYSALFRPNAESLLLQDKNMLREESRKWQNNLSAFLSVQPGEIDFIEKSPALKNVFRSSNFGLQLRYLLGYNDLIKNPGTSVFRPEIERYLDGSFSGNLEPFLQLDLQLSREFKVAGSHIKPFLSIENLLDRANFFWVYFITGQPDSDGFEEQVRIGPNGDQRVQEYRALVNDPNNYARPRTIRLGLSVEYR